MGKRNSLYYVKKDWVGGFRKFLLTFSYLFSINADILGGWVRKSSKMCDARHGWSQLNSITYQPKLTSNPVYREASLSLTFMNQLTVWPEPTWIDSKVIWQTLPQHQIAYLRGSESLSFKIPPFRPHFTQLNIIEQVQIYNTNLLLKINLCMYLVSEKRLEWLSIWHKISTLLGSALTILWTDWRSVKSILFIPAVSEIFPHD